MILTNVAPAIPQFRRRCWRERRVTVRCLRGSGCRFRVVGVKRDSNGKWRLGHPERPNAGGFATSHLLGCLGTQQNLCGGREIIGKESRNQPFMLPFTMIDYIFLHRVQTIICSGSASKNRLSQLQEQPLAA